MESGIDRLEIGVQIAIQRDDPAIRRLPGSIEHV
jgi:hypothetical protein